jgi:hypothetical protein
MTGTIGKESEINRVIGDTEEIKGNIDGANVRVVNSDSGFTVIYPGDGTIDYKTGDPDLPVVLDDGRQIDVFVEPTAKDLLDAMV